MTRSRKVWAAFALTALAVFGTVPRAAADFEAVVTVDGNTGVLYNAITETYTTSPLTGTGSNPNTIILAANTQLGYDTTPGDNDTFKEIYTTGANQLVFSVNSNDSQISYSSNGASNNTGESTNPFILTQINNNPSNNSLTGTVTFTVTDTGSSGTGITQPTLTPLNLTSYVETTASLIGQSVSLSTTAYDYSSGSNSATTPTATISLANSTPSGASMTTTATYNNGGGIFTPYVLESALAVTTQNTGASGTVSFVADSTAYAPAPPSALLLGLGLFGAGAFARLRRRFSPVVVA